MFDFLAESPQDRARLCGGGHTRREFLQVGALAAIGLSLPQYLRARESGLVKPGHDQRACIMIFNLGGPSHIDLWDMKPDAPSEIRGPFQPIRTRSDAFEISELLPRHAKIADKFSLVRSCHHDGAAVHDAGWQMMQTGRRFTGGIHTPHAGSVASYLMGRKTDLPPFVVLPQLMGRGRRKKISRCRTSCLPTRSARTASNAAARCATSWTRPRPASRPARMPGCWTKISTRRSA